MVIFDLMEEINPFKYSKSKTDLAGVTLCNKNSSYFFNLITEINVFSLLYS